MNACYFLSKSKFIYSSFPSWVFVNKKIKTHLNFPRFYSDDSNPTTFLKYDVSESSSISQDQYEKLSNKTLDRLNEDFEYIGENCDVSTEYDVLYSSGVLNVQFGKKTGVYVINKQAPNRQLWLSSPISGPKRFDYVSDKWIYKNSKENLHELLTNEISLIINQKYIFKV